MSRKLWMIVCTTLTLLICGCSQSQVTDRARATEPPPTIAVTLPNLADAQANHTTPIDRVDTLPSSAQQLDEQESQAANVPQHGRDIDRLPPKQIDGLPPLPGAGTAPADGLPEIPGFEIPTSEATFLPGVGSDSELPGLPTTNVSP